jgi:hypothetical protein
VAARFKAWAGFICSNSVAMGSNLTPSMDTCVHIILRVGGGLTMDRSSIKGILLTVYRIKKLKKAAKAQQRAVEPLIITITILN